MILPGPWWIVCLLLAAIGFAIGDALESRTVRAWLARHVHRSIIRHYTQVRGYLFGLVISFLLLITMGPNLALFLWHNLDNWGEPPDNRYVRFHTTESDNMIIEFGVRYQTVEGYKLFVHSPDPSFSSTGDFWYARSGDPKGYEDKREAGGWICGSERAWACRMAPHEWIDPHTSVFFNLGITPIDQCIFSQYAEPNRYCSRGIEVIGAPQWVIWETGSIPEHVEVR